MIQSAVDVPVCRRTPHVLSVSTDLRSFFTTTTETFPSKQKRVRHVDGLQEWATLISNYFAGGGYFLKSFSIALVRFLLTFAGSFPEPRVLLAWPFQIWFLAATS